MGWLAVGWLVAAALDGSASPGCWLGCPAIAVGGRRGLGLQFPPGLFALQFRDPL